MTKEATYTVTIKCRNCGYTDDFVEIKSGVTVQEFYNGKYLDRATCKKCDCCPIILDL